MSLTTPATDEGTSTVALSVSNSTTGCSFSIVSPTFTSTRRTSPVVTFSPSSGTLNSVTEGSYRLSAIGSWLKAQPSAKSQKPGAYSLRCCRIRLFGVDSEILDRLLNQVRGHRTVGCELAQRRHGNEPRVHLEEVA